MVHVKICGNTNAEDVGRAIEYGADYLGFVFAQSKRQISLPNARKIMNEFPDFKNFVGIFADQPQPEVEQVAIGLNLRWLQFHGNETNDYCQHFRSKGYSVIKAFSIQSEDSLKAFGQYDVDAFLLDSYSPNEKGGSGKTFDWSIAQKASPNHRPFFLAGGLNIHNVAIAIQTVQPYAVDVASGIEKNPGVKDPKLLKQFIEIAKSTVTEKIKS